MRNSDPDAAVYWLARMVEAGEDPLYIARRLVRFASEDIGNADPQALTLAVATKDAVHFIGMPEGNTALAQAAIYLAVAPKSNAVYTAYGRAATDVHEAVAEPVPLALRNAPTTLMKDLAYGKAYQYAHDDEDGTTAMDCLPPSLADRTYYEPTDRGLEKAIGERIAQWRAIKRRKGGLDTDSRPGALITIRGGPTMPGTVYYIGRALQVLGMWLLLVAIFTAARWGPSPRNLWRRRRGLHRRMVHRPPACRPVVAAVHAVNRAGRPRQTEDPRQPRGHCARSGRVAHDTRSARSSSRSPAASIGGRRGGRADIRSSSLCAAALPECRASSPA